MSASRQVNRKGEKPASSPNLDAELRRLKSAARRAPTEADAPREVSTLAAPSPPEGSQGPALLLRACGLR